MSLMNALRQSECSHANAHLQADARRLDEAERLLAAVRRPNLPTVARARLLHEVEAELGSQARRVASMTMKGSGGCSRS